VLALEVDDDCILGRMNLTANRLIKENDGQFDLDVTGPEILEKVNNNTFGLRI